MIMKVVISKRFFDQVNEAAIFLSNVSYQAANDLLENISVTIEKIKMFPTAFPRFLGNTIAGINYRKANLVNGRYAVIYSLKEDYIYVNMFIDYRQNNNRLLDLLD